MKRKIESYFFIATTIILILFPWWLVFDSFWKAFAAFILTILLLIILLQIINKSERFVNNNNNNNDLTANKIELFNFIREKWKFLLSLFVLYFLSHLYALTKPVLPIDDEHFHIAKGLFFLQPIKLFVEKLELIWLYPFITILILLLILLSFFFVRKLFIKKNITLAIYIEMLYKTKLGIFSLFFVLINYFFTVFFAFNYFFQSIGTKQLSWLTRYGPLGTIINLFVSLIGFQELFFIRLVQVLFLFGSSIILYFISQFYLDKKTSSFVAAIFLFIPSVFYFGNHAFLEAGVLFFSLLSIYFFLVWNSNNKNDDNNNALLFCFFSLFIGFFYKDNLLFIYIAFCAFLFFELLHNCYKQILVKKKINEKIEKIKDALLLFLKEQRLFIRLSLFFLVFALGWIIIRNQFLKNTIAAGYSFNFFNIFSFDLLFRYAKLSPLMLTVLFSIICSIGFFVFLLRKKTKEERLLLWWIIVPYIIYTSYSWRTAVPRFYLQFLPAIIIIGFLFFEWMQQFLLLKKNSIKYILYFMLFFYLFTSSLWLTYHEIDNRFWDYDGLYNHIKKDTAENDKILFLTHDIYYYFFKYNIKNPIITENEFRRKEIVEIDAFYLYLKENNVKYIVIPNKGSLYTSIGMYYPDPSKDKFLDDDRQIILALNEQIDKISILNNTNLNDTDKNKNRFVSGQNILYLQKVS